MVHRGVGKSMGAFVLLKPRVKRCFPCNVESPVVY